MKKIYAIIIPVFIGAFCLCYTAHAQSQQFSKIGMKPISTTALKGSIPSQLALLDTMYPPVFFMPCFTGNPTNLSLYYFLSNGGYLTGNNKYNETECAQRYAFSGTGTISEVFVLFGAKSGTTANTSVKVYNVAAAAPKKPTTVVGTSTPIAVSDLLTGGAITSYTFATAATITGNFAVSVVYPTTPAAGDTVAVFSTINDCHSPDSMSYVKLNGIWQNTGVFFNAKLPSDTNIDVMIFPVVDITSNVNEYPSSNGLTLMGAYPNPASDFTNIRYSIDEPSTVSIEVFDLSGRVIQRSSEKLISGPHDLNVSLKDIAAGNYYYTIRTAKTRLTSKFVVTK